MEDEKRVDDEALTELTEKVNHIVAIDIPKVYKAMEHELQMIDSKLQEKVDSTSLPKIEEKILGECEKLQ